ncbi:hypothetical protein [Pseudomonas sp. BBP2017]|uniref:hypothetical protein n=1 Tax=Pseudomonas sp. BBP2017 TaxID=2109731 RepID=UPI000D12A952|nr:hypothetical protein [Pseudomonas sp. BBP2017]PSS51594.1 hypothetical protein C6382_17065 [Pseudomonas sp. BBP2017]
MLLGRLLSGITLLVGLEALALPTTTLSPDQRAALGKQLAEHAGASQWQQLWQRSRHAGYLHEQSTVPHFSLDSNELIKAAALTLSQPKETSAVNQTQVLYRRDFAPKIVGKHAQTSLSAVCIWVDWRALPEHAVNRPAPYLGQISLLLVHPCQ